MINRARVLLLGGITSFLLGSTLSAQTMNYSAQVKAGETKYRSPEDLIDRVPFLAEIPRSFIVGDGFKMKISGRELRIDHMAYRSHAPISHRECLIGLSYTTPVAFFTSRIDVPLFSSKTLALSDWSRSSLGDYVVYLSQKPIEAASIKFIISAHF